MRAEIAAGSELGKKVSGLIAAGNLVPDELMISILEQRAKAAKGGIIFDGFPRTVAQAQALDEMMKRLQRDITAVVCPRAAYAKNAVSRRLLPRNPRAIVGANYTCGPMTHPKA